MIPTRVMCCLKINGTYCFKDLHEYLVSLYSCADCDYYDGFTTISNIGRKSAEEIIFDSREVWIKGKGVQ